MSDMKMYNILGIMKNLTKSASPAQLNEDVAQTTTVYESVEPRGSISEAVNSLESKYATFKESTKPDFLDVDKDGNKKEPFKKAVKDKNNAKGAFKDKFGGDAKELTSKLKIKEEQDSKAYYGVIDHPDGEGEELQYKFRVKNGKPVVVSCEDSRYQDECQADAEKHYRQMSEGQGPYELYNPKHPKFKANYDKFKAENPGCKLEDFINAMKKREHGLNEGMGMSDELAAQKIADKIQGTPDLDITKLKRYVTIYLPMVSKQQSDVDYLTALVHDRLVDLGLVEAKDELTDIDSYQFADPDADTSVAPASREATAAEKRRRLQDIEDRRAEKDDWFDGKNAEPNVRIHRAKLQNEPEELDEYSQAEFDQAMGDFNAKGGQAKQLPPGSAKNPISTASRHIAGRGEAGKGKAAGRGAKTDATGKPVVDVYEVAPPGAKAERMVKHIKKGYSADGNLSKKEKGIAYATAWKAKNAGVVEEGTEFKDTVKNSAPNIKKAKLKESRMLQEGDYFYETVAKALAEKSPHLNTADNDFYDAVRKEMIAQGIAPNRARNILLMDEDFLSDVATSYGHYCRELAAEGVLQNAPMDNAVRELDEYTDSTQPTRHPDSASNRSKTRELDEIARLAGLPTNDKICESCGMVESVCACEQTDLGEGEAQEKTEQEQLNHYHELIKQGMDPDDAEVEAFNDELTEMLAPNVEVGGKEVDMSSLEFEDVYEWDQPDYADAYVSAAMFVDGTPLSEIELGELEKNYAAEVHTAIHNSLHEEDEMTEGNEFSGALAAAKANGDKEFEVDGKKYTVKEDINLNITANGEQDALNLIRKLSGMAEIPQITSIEQIIDEYCDACDSTPCCCGESVAEQREIEYTNTPNEQTAGIDAAIPSGNGESRAKKMYKKEYPGDNPMAVKESVEDTLWKKYSGMLKQLIQK